MRVIASGKRSRPAADFDGHHAQAGVVYVDTSGL